MFFCFLWFVFVFLILGFENCVFFHVCSVLVFLFILVLFAVFCVLSVVLPFLRSV